MSFSSTPLGSGKRVDHPTFMRGAKPPSRENREENNQSASDHNNPPSPRRRAAPLAKPLVASSFAYGSSSSSQQKPTSSGSQRAASPARSTASTRRSARDDDDPLTLTQASAQEPGAVRYQRLQQRNQALGPGVISTPPRPTAASLGDTSVIVATAFHQAAAMTNLTGTSASNLRKGPSSRGSASGENGISRQHLAPPRPVPPRQRSPVPERIGDSEEVQETDEHGRPVNHRAKSSMEVLTDYARGKSPSFFRLRAGSPPAAESAYQSMILTGGENTNGSVTEGSRTFDSNQPSYDYQVEENIMAEFDGTANGSSQQGRTIKKKKSIHHDQQAFKPPQQESSSEESDSPGRPRRKKNGARSTLDGSLPMVGPNKQRRKRLSKPGKGSGGRPRLQDEQEVSGMVPTVGSLSRDEDTFVETPDTSVEQVPDENDETFDDSYVQDQPGDDSEAVIDDLVLEPDVTEDASREEESRIEEAGSKVAWALGTALRFTLALVMIIWHGIASAYRTLVRPYDWFAPRIDGRQRNPLTSFAPLLGIALALLAGYQFLNQPPHETDIGDITPPPPPRRPWWGRSGSESYSPPAVPPETLQELVDRLTKIEHSHSSIAHERLNDERSTSAMKNHLAKLDDALDSAAKRARDAEESYRVMYQRKASELQTELDTVRNAVSSLADRVGDSNPDVASELRSQLSQLADRLGGVEGVAKEALDNSKHAVKAPSGSGWWSKPSADGKPITVRSTDGQDITSLLSVLVDTAVDRFSKDIIAKADFALYSGGGRILPSMTSPTYEIRPSKWTHYIAGSLTGHGFASGHAPVVALTPDNNVGKCWPFAGAQGQLGVVLSRSVHISEITIDHAPRELALNLHPAPRGFKVWGLVEGASNLEKLAAYQEEMTDEEKQNSQPPKHLPKSAAVSHVLLSSFEYDLSSPSHIQTFSIDERVRNLELDIGVVVFQITSNWGSPDYTCLYRVRVHGIDAHQQEQP